MANVFPVLAAAPRYFSGAIQLGGLMQTAQAVGQVQGTLSWFIDAYPRLAEWRATVDRLSAFRSACAADVAPVCAAPGLQTGTGAVDMFCVDSVTLAIPDCRRRYRCRRCE